MIAFDTGKVELKMKDEIIGTRIGIYDILYECDFKDKDGHRLYHVRCSECGWETDMRKSCLERARHCTHIGLSGSYINTNIRWENKRIKRIYQGMRDRCYNLNNKSYRWYGEKGIRICDEWMNNPKSFESWALNNGYEDNLTIDRLEEDKDYCPENCAWITGEDNTKYKSTTSLIDVDNEIHTGKDWSKKLGFGVNIINTYIRKYGEENTKEFIHRYLNNPGHNPKHQQSYYDLYMNDNLGQLSF